MRNAHHALELFHAPAEEIRQVIRQHLNEAGFKVASSAPSDSHIRAQRGSATGITDRQTGRMMEVLVRGDGQRTAVSVYHHTTGVGPLVGATFGTILQDEVNALFECLGQPVGCPLSP